jgi:flagellar motility protein MotE (MotC chaperone)
MKMENLNLFNRQKSIVCKNLNFTNQNDSIEKAIEFEKTEEQIYAGIDKTIQLKEQQVENLNEKMSNLQKQIGTEPDSTNTYWGGNRDEELYEAYKLDYSVISCGNKLYSSNNETTKTEKNIEDVKQEYNNIANKRMQCKSRIEELKLIQRNIDAKGKRKHKLTDYDLKNYGL